MRRFVSALAVCAVLVACGGGGGGGGGGDDGGGGGGGGQGLALETYDAGFMSLKKPVGWEVSIGGVCTTLGFVVRDPDAPLRQFFFFSSLGPVYTSQAQRDFDWQVTGGNMTLIPYLDAPVVAPLSPANFLAHWPGLSTMDAAHSFLAEFPLMDEAAVVSDAPQAPLLPSGQTSLLRSVFRLGGRSARASSTRPRARCSEASGGANWSSGPRHRPGSSRGSRRNWWRASRASR